MQLCRAPAPCTPFCRVLLRPLSVGAVPGTNHRMLHDIVACAMQSMEGADDAQRCLMPACMQAVCLDRSLAALDPSRASTPPGPHPPAPPPNAQGDSHEAAVSRGRHEIQASGDHRSSGGSIHCMSHVARHGLWAYVRLPDPAARNALLACSLQAACSMCARPGAEGRGGLAGRRKRL